MSLRNCASVSAIALALLAGACTQGEEIASPGGTTSGPTPGGGSGGGGGGGGGTASCPAGFVEGASVGNFTTCNVSGVILADLTLPFVDGVAYRLDGRVDVGIDTGADGNTAGGQSAELTIEPGVILFGASGDDYVVVNRGSEIDAEGTASQPIIFTSEDDLLRQSDANASNDDGGSSIGEWGGLVVLGAAPINRCAGAATPGSIDCENIIEGVTAPLANYGGANTFDSSGTLSYVQVRFAGNELASGNELNGISFGGVGSGTQLDHIQVHNNSDDGIEMFGGTANLKYVVLTGNDDDSLDTDNGWQGSVQYLVIAQREDGGDNGVEASSVGAGVSPLSNAKVSNFTIVGNRSNAWRLNTGTVGQYVNGVVNYGSECFRWQSTAGDATPGYGGVDVDPTFNSVLFDCSDGIARDEAASGEAAVAADANNVVGANSLAATFFPGPNELAVTPFDVGALGTFFEPVDYVGAFSADETETANWATGWTFSLFPEPTCPLGTTDSGLELNGTTVCDLSGVITSDIRLTRGTFYRIDGRVDVGIDTGADGTDAAGAVGTLTIESGVTLFGRSGDDYMVVNRGSQIFANGTASNPVVFTSEDDVTDTQPDPINAIGEWGGLVILGKAPINRCAGAATPGTVDCENIIEGVTAPLANYGGATPSDNSGALRFVQIKHAGNELASGNELNGISFGGVGDGTQLDHIQVHNNSDDGIEMFGGTANLKYVVLTGNDDDSLDTDNGWQGKVQFLIIAQRADGGDNGVEASSVGAGITPLSNATVSNFTIVGNRSNAWRLNTGTVGRYVNGVVAYGSECFRWQTTAGDGVTGYGGIDVDPSFDSVLLDCSDGIARDDTASAEAAVAAGTNVSTNVANTLTQTFVNGTAEAAVTPFDVTTLSSFFDPVDYIGAVKDTSDRWWAGWSCGLEASDPC